VRCGESCGGTSGVAWLGRSRTGRLSRRCPCRVAVSARATWPGGPSASIARCLLLAWAPRCWARVPVRLLSSALVAKPSHAPARDLRAGRSAPCVPVARRAVAVARQGQWCVQQSALLTSHACRVWSIAGENRFRCLATAAAFHSFSPTGTSGDGTEDGGSSETAGRQPVRWTSLRRLLIDETES
jgi:hypothetical protein